MANSDVAEFLSDGARLPNLREKVPTLFRGSHRRSAAGRGPHGSDERADHETTRGNAVGKALEILIGRIDADVGLEQKNIDAVEADAIHLGGCREVEHRFKVDARFVARPAFPDKARPHRVVEFRILESSC